MRKLTTIKKKPSAEKEAEGEMKEKIIRNPTNYTDEDQASMLIELLENEEKVKDMYKGNFSQYPLVKKLFVTGIDPQTFTPNPLQERFEVSRTKNGSIVFYPTQITSEIFRVIKQGSRSSLSLLL